MKIEELKEQLFALNGMIRLILKECGYDEHRDIGICVDYDATDKDEHMLYKTFSDLMKHLSYSNLLLEYLQKPVKEEGVITKTKIGKYRLNKTTINDGDCVEILQQGNGGKWELIVFGDIYKLEGRYARIRK